jgi:hypothetical protein
MIETGEAVTIEDGNGERALRAFKLNAAPLIHLFVDVESNELVYAVDYRGERPGLPAKEPSYYWAVKF